MQGSVAAQAFSALIQIKSNATARRTPRYQAGIRPPKRNAPGNARRAVTLRSSVLSAGRAPRSYHPPAACRNGAAPFPGHP